MKIIIDAENTKKQKTGVGYYTFNLIKGLMSEDRTNEYSLVFWKLRDPAHFNPIGDMPDNFKLKKIRLPYSLYFKLFKAGLKIPFSLFAGKADIYIFPNFVIYNNSKKNNLVVIYDVSYLKYPQYSDKKNVKFLSKFVRETVGNSSQVITISESSKKEIEHFYKIPSKNITVISPSYDSKLFYKRTDNEISYVKNKYNIVGKYLFFTSTLEPRKNVENIVKAYIKLPKEIKDEHSLVLAGGKGWQDDGIISTIKKAQESGEKIITTGYVPEEDLPVLYSGASVFLYPSFYEGFGIPILEAFACEVPVITANNSSMPEVAGNAALYINAEDFTDLKEKIVSLVNNESLKEELISKGMQQLSKFDWSKSANKLIEVFNKFDA